MAAELAAVFSDDRALLWFEPMPAEKRAVVVAGEEARLLALGPACSSEPCTLGLRPCYLLVLLAEREGDSREVARLERREHVALVLRRVDSAREEETAVSLDDARVVAGRQPLGAGTPREREQLGEAEAAVAAGARVRRLAAGVAADEGRDNRAPELLAQVERHVRHAEPVTRLARGDHALGRAAGALRIRSVRIEPETEGDPDRVRPGAEERDRAVDAAAHRHGHPPECARSAEHRPDRVRERVHHERLAADRRRLEERQACDVALEPGPVRLDDPVAVDEQAHGCPLAAAARVSEHFAHALTVDEGPAPSSRTERCDPGLPGGCRARLRQCLGRDAGSLSRSVGSTCAPDSARGAEHGDCSAG